jgi:hypothetical protein
VRYWGLTIAGLAIAGASLVALDWGIYHLVRTGTCASGGAYVSARPCPPGTGLHILAVVGSVFGGVLGVATYAGRGSGGRPSRIGLGTLMWSLLFLSIAGSVALAAFGPASGGDSGVKVTATVIAAIFVPMGLMPLLAGALGGHRRPDQAVPLVSPPLIAAARPIPPRRAADRDPLERLARLGDLRDRGIVTEAEFEEQKRRLLGEV